MQKVQVQFSRWIEEGFNLYKDNFKTLVLATIFVVVISTVTAFILAGPMLAGLALVTLELRDKKEPRPEAGKVFKGFDYFGQAFLFVAVWGIAIFVASVILGVLPVVGQLASFFVAYAAQALLMFGIFLIVDRKMEFWPASQESINTVKNNFWPFFGLSTVAWFIGSIGAIAFGIGVVFTIPIQGCILTVVYRRVYG
jgi:archaellum biogenesis protein FlaJ (TadC family)